MMILIAPTIIAVILLVIAFIIDYTRKFNWETTFTLKSIAIVLIILIISGGIVAFFVNQCAESSTTAYRIQYETLVYQLENGAYENVVEYNRKDLMDDICDYNSHIESGRILSKNPWIGVYYPEDWDNLPLIELENYK